MPPGRPWGPPASPGTRPRTEMPRARPLAPRRVRGAGQPTAMPQARLSGQRNDENEDKNCVFYVLGAKKRLEICSCWGYI